MSTAHISIQIDDNIHHQAAQVFAGYGLTSAEAIGLFLRQVAATRKVPLGADFMPEAIADEQNPVTMQAVTDVRAGRVTTYENFAEMMRDLHEDRHS